MKFSEVEFTLGDASHTLRAECESKFSGLMLTLELDGHTIALERGARLFHFFRISLEGKELTIFIRLSAGGTPLIELLFDGRALSTNKDEESFFRETLQKAGKSGKLSILKNALLNFILFSAAGLAVGLFKTRKFDVNAILIALLCGTVVTLVFLVWDILDHLSAMKHLRKSHASPTVLDLKKEEALEDAVDESVDPDSIEVPADSVSFYFRLQEDEEAEEKENAEKAGEVPESDAGKASERENRASKHKKSKKDPQDQTPPGAAPSGGSSPEDHDPAPKDDG